MNSVQTGSFIYHDRKGSRVLSWLILAATLLITLLSRLLFENSLITIIVFIVALLFLAMITMPLENKLYVHEVNYELNSQKLILHMPKQDLVLYRNEVNGVGCDPVLERGGKDANIASYWKITIQTVPKKDQKSKKYEIFSQNVVEKDDDNKASILQFQAFGKELKHWFGMTS